MLREPRCSICANPSTSVAVAERRAKGDSLQQIASRLKLTKSSVARHAKHAQLPRVDLSPSSGRKSFQPKRGVAGRCPTCGILATDADPKALIRRAERTLHYGETIVMKAVEEGDDRLALQGLDRVRTALELLLKVHGLLAPEGGITIDNRKQVISVLSDLSDDELRALIAGASGGAQPALANVTDNQKLSTVPGPAAGSEPGNGRDP
jgi:hypothetical protein